MATPKHETNLPEEIREEIESFNNFSADLEKSVNTCLKVEELCSKVYPIENPLNLHAKIKNVEESLDILSMVFDQFKYKRNCLLELKKQGVH